MNQEVWDMRFLEMAKLVASWSKDPSTKTGAVFVDANRRVVAVGYNGLPQKIEDTHERLHNRDLKYKTTVHCERNALIFAKQSLEGCTLYTWPFMSCAPCASMMIQAGIVRHVAPRNDNPRWQEDFRLTEQLLKEAGVKLDVIDVDTNP